MAKIIKEDSTVVIHLNLKTLLYVLGILLSIYGTGFYFLNDKLGEVNSNIEKIKVEDIEVLKTSASRTDGQLQLLIQYINSKNKTNTNN